MSEMEVEEPMEEEDALALAVEEAKGLPADLAIAKYKEAIVGYEERVKDEVGTKLKEEAIMALARVLAAGSRFDEIVELLTLANGPFFEQIARAKTAKIVRNLLDIVAEGSLELQAELCTRVIAWCRAEKRTFLRQRVESRMVAVDYERGRYDEALSLVTRLLAELKKLDDKQMLVETHLVESKIHAALRNVPKAKAALTAARTNGNAVYVGPKLQAQLDEMSGTLHCEESDYATSYSYFLEAFEGYDSMEDTLRATKCLKYMLLCQILNDKAKPMQQSAKHQVKYAGPDLDSMAQVAKAAKARSLRDFELTTQKYHDQLMADLLIKHHLDQLYDHILEMNLSKIVEPFSRVEIDHIATLIELPVFKVEKKLAQMILDKKLTGTLDTQCLHISELDADSVDPSYDAALTVIKNMDDVVTSLFKRADALLETNA